MQQKVSIVVPSYNHEAYIVDALRSAAAQTYPDIEIVVVDDGSSDGSVAAIERFAATCTRPVKLIVQANAGAHSALERGIAAATGSIISILNSDDVYASERLSEILRAAGDLDDFIAFTEVEYIDEHGKPFPQDDHHVEWYKRMLAEADATPGIGFALMLGNFAVSSSNFVFSRSYHNKNGPFSAYKIAHDLDFLLKGIADREPLFIRKPLLQYRIHSTNTMKTSRELIEPELNSIFQEYLVSLLAKDPKNRRAPGSRDLLFYLAYFLRHHSTWYSGRPLEDVVRQMIPLERTPTEKDAWALYGECKWLVDEVRTLQDRVAAPDRELWNRNQELWGRIAILERELADKEKMLADALRELGTPRNASRRSWRWRITAPIRWMARQVHKS